MRSNGKESLRDKSALANLSPVPSSGCGPIGLITAAVAHAYSARKIIAFDVRPSRVAFARKYLSPLTGRPIIDHVFHIADIPDFPKQPSTDGNGHATAEASHDDEVVEETVGDKMWRCAQENMREIVAQCGLEAEGGVDRVVEASGAQDAMLHGVAICKQGGVCVCSLSLPRIRDSHWYQTDSPSPKSSKSASATSRRISYPPLL